MPHASDRQKHFQNIYSNHVDAYDLLVTREDYRQNLWKALEEITSFSGKTVVELGAGTGRLTMPMAEKCASVHAFDESETMLELLREKMRAKGFKNIEAGIADHCELPVHAEIADIAIEGWAFGHLISWNPGAWKNELDRAIGEMKRVLKPQGKMIVIETLGTGQEKPRPPSSELAELYEILEKKFGFSSTAIRTDYRFLSQHEAEHTIGLFFGPEMKTALSLDSLILPECTGIWWSGK